VHDDALADRLRIWTLASRLKREPRPSPLHLPYCLT
jgi:hypothetical protein